MQFKSLFHFFVITFLLSEAVAQEEVYVAPDVNIISITPVQGSGIDLDKVPSNIQTITEGRLSR